MITPKGAQIDLPRRASNRLEVIDVSLVFGLRKKDGIFETGEVGDLCRPIWNC